MHVHKLQLAQEAKFNSPHEFVSHISIAQLGTARIMILIWQAILSVLHWCCVEMTEQIRKHVSVLPRDSY